MKRFLLTVDKWGPALVSVLTLFLMSGVLWWYSERIAKLEGQVTTLQHQIDNNSTSKDQINGLKNWIIAVYSIGEANGWKLPEPPQDTQQKKER